MYFELNKEEDLFDFSKFEALTEEEKEARNKRAQAIIATIEEVEEEDKNRDEEEYSL